MEQPMTTKQGNQSLNPDADGLSSDAADLDGSQGSTKATDKASLAASLSPTQSVTSTGTIKVSG
jgi:hypothetical protein